MEGRARTRMHLVKIQNLQGRDGMYEGQAVVCLLTAWVALEFAKALMPVSCRRNVPSNQPHTCTKSYGL